MKEKSSTNHLQNTSTASHPNNKSINELFSLDASVSRVNELFITWLESLGVASSAQADEHIEPKGKAK